MGQSKNYKRKLKLGIIGAGNVIQYLHGPALKLVPEIEVVAIADINAINLKKVADKFGIIHRYTDYLHLLKHPDLDAVAVCSPSDLHVEMAIAVIESGKHLFLEKPIATTLEDADRLVAVSKQSNVKVLMGFNLRFHPLLQKARQWIESGKLGSPTIIDSTFTVAGHPDQMPSWMFMRKRGGGSLLGLAVHHFDLWSFLFQNPVEQISALSDGDSNWEDRRVTLAARLHNGALITAIFAQDGQNCGSIKVCGSIGCLDLSYFHWDSLAFTPRVRLIARRRQRIQYFMELVQQLPHNWVKSGTQLLFKTYQFQWQHFASMILDDIPAQCTLEDGQQALKIAIAAIRAIETSRTITIAL